jgi:hypothetical protein
MDWIDVAEDREEWRAVVNTVMNLQVPFVECFTKRSPALCNSQCEVHAA